MLQRYLSRGGLLAHTERLAALGYTTVEALVELLHRMTDAELKVTGAPACTAEKDGAHRMQVCCDASGSKRGLASCGTWGGGGLTSHGRVRFPSLPLPTSPRNETAR